MDGIGSQPLVSVVTPVYNGEHFLKECIESVLAQEYTNWEYLIVNNKSTDNSLQIATEYERKDKRIHIFNNDSFLDVIANFNNAVRKISNNSKYCKIICADDWIYPESISRMVELAETNPKLGIVSSYRLAGDEVVPSGMPYNKNVFAGTDIARMNLLDGPYTFGSPTALLYRSELTRRRDSFFNELLLSADTEVCYEILQQWDFGFIHQILSFSRIHDKSVSSSYRSLNINLPDHIYMFKKYGPIYLEEKVYELRLKRYIQQYYKYLGENLASLFKRDFSYFHRQYLKQLNIPFCWIKVLCWWALVNSINLFSTIWQIRKLFLR